MYLLEMLGLLGVSGLVVVGTRRRIAHLEFSQAWRTWFFVLCCVGVGLGIWLLTIVRSSTTERAWSFPFVTAGGNFFDGRWHDGGVGRFAIVALLADIAFAMACCVLPLWIASFAHGRHTSSTGEGKPHGDW